MELAAVVARIKAPGGHSAEAVLRASRKAVKQADLWRREAAEAYPGDQREQRQFYVLKRAVAARDELLTGKRR